jgi:hypothetical protein
VCAPLRFRVVRHSTRQSLPGCERRSDTEAKPLIP